jgi:hypothetical protein
MFAGHIVVGAIVGALCSPLVGWALWHRDFTQARPIVLWSTAALVIATAWIMPRNDAPTTILVAGGFLAVTSLAARRALPKVWESPGLCRFCGYDIRASVEFNRCPECGRGLKYDPWYNREAHTDSLAGKTVWFLAFLVRHPWVPVAVILVVRLAPFFASNPGLPDGP